MVGAFFMLGEIWDFLCPFLRNEVSAMANRIMANRIMGITVEIGGDTTKLQTALKGVNGQIKSTQQQLKDVDKLLKLDPGNTELLACIAQVKAKNGIIERENYNKAKSDDARQPKCPKERETASEAALRYFQMIWLIRKRKFN